MHEKLFHISEEERVEVIRVSLYNNMKVYEGEGPKVNTWRGKPWERAKKRMRVKEGQTGEI